MTQFKEGDTVMVLNGDHAGEFGIVCSSSKEFSALSINDHTATFHNSALKLESECVFSAQDLKEEQKLKNLEEIGTQAKRYNEGKPDLELLEFPYELQVELVKPLEDGLKYGRNNWMLGRNINELISCQKRHLSKFQSGEDRDPDSSANALHLASAAINAIMALHAYLLDRGYDTRTHEQKIYKE